MTVLAHNPAEIVDRGNTPHNLRLLLAQRRLYKRAKLFAYVRLAGVASLAFLAPIVVSFAPASAAWLGAIAGLWALLARAALRFQRDLVIKAARVQDEIDRGVFGLERNPSVVWLSGTEIAELTEGDLSESIDREKLRDWYDTIPDRVEGPVSIAIGQYANASYSRRLQQRQCRWISHSSVLLLALVFGAPLVANALFGQEITLLEWLVGAILPALPAGLELIDAISSHAAAIDKLCELEDEIESAITDGVPLSADQLTVFQNHLLEYRTSAPLIFEWLYWRGRTRDSIAARQAADTLLARQAV